MKPSSHLAEALIFTKNLKIMRTVFVYAALSLLAACNNSGSPRRASSVPLSTGSKSQQGDANKISLSLYPQHLYSGFDGQNSYQVPLMIAAGAEQGEKIEWSSSDSSMVSLKPDASDARNLMITTKKSGTVNIIASTKNGKVSVPLDITAYTQAQFLAGQQRFKQTASGTSSTASTAACISCHTQGGVGGDNTPTDIGVHSDQLIISTFTSGKSAEGTITQVKHIFAVSELEKIGLMSFLRSQKPKGYPNPDEDKRQQDERDDD
ncbi:MAG: hypothetical protein NTX25_02595 [Proteobacteria bacterium]|nr:hypothetical protein [Pseudomonadota bacterium]